MNCIFKAMAVAAVLTSTAFAAESTDVSLSREVDRYLEQSASKWDDPSTLRVFWSKAIKLETADGAFKLAINGRVMYDSFWSTVGTDDFQGGAIDLGDIGANGSYFRRIRIAIGGTVYKRTKYKIQIDFAGGGVALKDVYAGLTKVLNGDLLFGQAKEPFSLQELTSSKYIQVIERSMAVNAFAPARHIGAFWFASFAEQLIHAAWSWTWGQSDDGDGDYFGNGGGAFTVRVTGSPLYNKDKKTVLHVGLAISYRNTPDGVSYGTRPSDLGKGGKLEVDVATAESEIRYGFEIAYVWKMVNVQFEYIGVSTSTATGTPAGAEDPSFGGWYLEIGWFVTGESRTYDRKKGSFGRTSPKRNFLDGSGGFGAIQLAFRVDAIDLNDGTYEGGEAMTYAFGVNWHWNPNTRVMFNVAFSDVDDFASAGASSGGTITVFVVRVQFDF